MRDHRRSLQTEPTEVPLGIVINTPDKQVRFDYSVLADTPLRRQLRDAAMAVMADRGGDARSTTTAKEVFRSAREAHSALMQAGTAAEQPLDIRTVKVATLHRALFEGRLSPAPVKTTYARKLLLTAAEDMNAPCRDYLQNLRLHGWFNPSAPYSADELDAVIDWCRTRLNALFLRRAQALVLIGVDHPESATDDEVLQRALAVLAETPQTDVLAHRWWVAQVYAHGATPVPNISPTDRGRKHALQALFPDTRDAMAAALLVINEYGAEGSVLVSMDVTDVNRDTRDSSVMTIKGIKTRADKAVSRKGNSLSTWSGGRVLERWILVTAPARRWTQTGHLWLWYHRGPAKSDKVVRMPFATHIPERPIIQEGGAAVIDGPLDEGLRLSTRRMRKTWHARADRAFGSGFAGSLDPNHDQRTAWNFYRSMSLNETERQEVVSEGIDDYIASIKATGIVITEDMSREDVKTALIENGVEAETAERVLRDDVADSGTTKCSNPKAAPGQALGTMCRQTPFACVTCPNAIHTTAHLPVIIALSIRLREQKETLPAEEYVSKWTGVDIGVERILDAFSAPAIEKANQDIAAATLRLQALGEAYT